ncbi:MAG: IS110 family transposase [Bryobacteraceae bacterium]
MKKKQRCNLSQLAQLSEALTIGLDLGDKTSHYCVLDASGDVLAEGSLETTPSAFQAHLRTLPACRIALEVGAHSRWASSLLKEFGHEVIIANASQVRLIYDTTRKTDKVDARTLARLARIDPVLLSPIRHRSCEAHSHLCVIRAREALVTVRTQLINCVRGMVKSHGERLPRCSSDSFSQRIPGLIPAKLRTALLPLCEQIAQVSARIQSYDQVIEQLASNEYSETAPLRSVSGVGALTAITYVLTLEDPTRFTKSRDVGCYLGLKPKQSQSGQCSPQLGISKAGDCYLRKLLVGSAQYILGPFGPDTDLRRWGLELAKRGGPNAKKRAVVAVARKLAVLLHRLWISQSQYQPFRNMPNPQAVV